MYEVELKFPLDDRAEADISERLAEQAARPGEPVEQRDRYFAHPSRDFAETDEALRLRSIGGENRVTYKGPLVDAETKTRREIEIPFASGAEAAGEFARLLEALGFCEVRTVAKRRVPYRVSWEGWEVEVCLDRVEELGMFLELETAADEAGLEEARRSLWRLAGHLGLERSERRSYLRLLLQRDGPRL